MEIITMSALVAVSTVEVVLHTHAPANSVLRRNLWTHTHYLYGSAYFLENSTCNSIEQKLRTCPTIS